MRFRSTLAAALIAFAAALPLAQAQRVAPPTASSIAYPAKGAWSRRAPADVGLDAAKLDEAIAFSVANQNTATKDLAVDIPDTFKSEAPYNTVIGPVEARTGMNGVVIRHGYVAAEWGDVARADMTFSVTKTFLSTVVGVAYDRGLIKNVTDRVATYMPADVDLFTSEHNAPITWEHLLRQTSDWSGTLWGKPDWADRPPAGQTPAQWEQRELHAPGTFYKYNDTRVNLLALATLYVTKQPLPAMLKTSIMDPIGASDSWHWEAYDNANVTIAGKTMKSVTGGGHFGGGLFINAYDMARFGYLFLHHGNWNGKQLISEKWIGMASAPGPAYSAYGYCNWFLNTPNATTNGRLTSQMYKAAPANAVAFRGNGENIIYIDWDNDMVVVVRWMGRGTADFFAKVIAAVQK